MSDTSDRRIFKLIDWPREPTQEEENILLEAKLVIEIEEITTKTRIKVLLIDLENRPMLIEWLKKTRPCLCWIQLENWYIQWTDWNNELISEYIKRILWEKSE